MLNATLSADNRKLAISLRFLAPHLTPFVNHLIAINVRVMVSFWNAYLIPINY